MKMKFHLYRISDGAASRMQDEIVQYSQMPDVADMTGREQPFKADNKIIALERCEERDGMFLMDMMEARGNNFPGCYTSEKKNEDLPVKHGDKISQQTMAIYIPGKQNSYLICQYNHHGVKASSIVYYFISETDVLEPILKKDVMERFRTAEKVVSFRIKIDTTQKNESVPEMIKSSEDKGMSLAFIFKAAEDMKQHSNAKFLEFAISCGKSQKQGALAFIRSIPERLLSYAGVEKMEAGIKPTSEDKTEILDLLNHREVYEVDEGNLGRTDGMRYDHESRKRAILNSLSHFKSYIKD